jgi:hypothetical protein
MLKDLKVLKRDGNTGMGRANGNEQCILGAGPSTNSQRKYKRYRLNLINSISMWPYYLKLTKTGNETSIWMIPSIFGAGSTNEKGHI